ncbi:GTP-binding protein A [Madurella fahalii]|uniref:GTP-binding protein A n=1 Tax=Madurella fahalii TaxID=1157608 RepID=A0ABQ0GH73_9PEZI
MAPSNNKNNAEDSVVIALLGVTGAGKTTFIRHASGDTTLKVGHGIYSCTQEPQAIRFQLDGRSIALIDTPGFDDDTRSDVEILEQLAKWMAEQGHMIKKQLDGLILLQPITAHRVGGTERKRTRLLKNILGEDAYKHVIIATTMWEQIKDENDMKERLNGRRDDLWGDMVTRGTEIVKHANNKDSAHEIIRKIIRISEKSGKLHPLLQKELVKNPLVVESTAGKDVKRQLENNIELTRRELKEHVKNRPPRPKSKRKNMSEANSRARIRWKEWHEDKKTLEERLDMLQFRLKRLNSLSFKLRNFWVSLFGR